MSLFSSILDGLGSKTPAKVEAENSLRTSALPYPGFGIPDKTIPFSALLSVDGLGVTTDFQSLVGTVANPVLGYVNASEERADRYLVTASILIGATAAALNKFAAGSILANGVQFFFSRPDREAVLGQPLKSNFEILRIGDEVPAVGAGNNAFVISNAVGNGDYYMSTIHLSKFSPGGIRLPAQSQSIFGIKIQDTLPAMTNGRFDIIVSGFDRIA